MRKRHGGLPAFVGALALSWTLATAEGAEAACVDFATALDGAPAVFVGTVVHISFSNGNRMATFRVEEVWKGDVGPVAIVDGGRPPQEVRRITVAGEASVSTGAGWYTGRMFQLGGRYLVAPWEEDGVLRDDGCTATRWYTAELDRLRPADARTIALDAPAPTLGETRLAAPDGASSGARGWMIARLVLAGAAAVGLAACLWPRAVRALEALRRR